MVARFKTMPYKDQFIKLLTHHYMYMQCKNNRGGGEGVWYMDEVSPTSTEPTTQ